MNIRQARKILGDLSEDVSDEILENDIQVAELLSNLFFSKLTRSGEIHTRVENITDNVP